MQRQLEANMPISPMNGVRKRTFIALERPGMDNRDLSKTTTESRDLVVD